MNAGAGLVRGDDVARGHGLLPAWTVRAARLVEPVVGAAVIAAWIWGDPGRHFWVAAAVWHTALAGYLAVLLRVRGRVPCGCLDGVSPVSPLKIAVGGLWAAASVVMAAGAVSPPEVVVVRLLHLAVAGFVALLAVVAASVSSVFLPRRIR